MALAAGTRLGSYEIAASIGAGAMGEVYRARDLKLGREVAVKVLRAELASDSERLRRFEQEARAASALNHPNIVHIYDIGREGDTHYLVMELVEGATLRELLREAPFENERILDLARQMAAGLAKAHAAGIVHRDVKPENIMITPEGFVKILDFGLAKLLGVLFEPHSEMATLVREGTRHGTLIGTVEYMSPEQAAGKSVDHRSDQFSLGLILYEMATGRLAFRRETAAQTLASIIENEPRPISELNTHCPAGLEKVVSRCLRKSPSERYGETRDVVRELEDIPARDPLPPTPRPVPRSPKPETPSFGTSLRGHVERELKEALGEAERDLKDAFGDETLYLRSGEGKVRTLSERRLRRRLRRNRFAGDEMIRRARDDRWVPLYESDVFREEVPYEGDPDAWVRRRKIVELARHVCVFVSFGAAWYVFRGEVPAWMGFWGIGLVMHGFRTLPALLARPKRAPALVEAEPAAALPQGLLSKPFQKEVDDVKELLMRRGGEKAGALLEEIDGIVARMTDLATKRRGLAEQTSPAERSRLVEASAEAERRRAAAERASDRRLYQRQLDVLRQRERAIEKARGVIDRLDVRQDVAEQQLKQLRLDLARAEASSANVPELTSRLQDIRHEVDAEEIVDDAMAEELLS